MLEIHRRTPILPLQSSVHEEKPPLDIPISLPKHIKEKQTTDILLFQQQLNNYQCWGKNLKLVPAGQVLVSLGFLAVVHYVLLELTM